MPQTLSAPEVLRTWFDEAFNPRLPALCLRWDEGGQAEKLWELPEGVSIVGPAPRSFGFSARRIDDDLYAVRLLWDQTRLSWPGLSRAQLLTSALAPLLAALGTDLWCLLDQPLPSAHRGRPRAA
jgi:hypothetical protein